MANIILINDQDQEQTLAGVTSLVSRGPDGDVEFSVGGGGAVSGGKTIIYALPGGPGQISAENTSASTESAAVALLAENDRTIDANDALTVTWDSNGTWSIENNTVKGTVISDEPDWAEDVYYIPKTSEATITNNTSGAIKLNFSWTSDSKNAAGNVTVEGSVQVGSSDAKSGQYSGTLEAGQSVAVKIESAKAIGTDSQPYQNILLSDFAVTTAQSGVFLTATPNGSYTVKTGSGEAKTVSAADENGNFTYDGANYNTNDPANLPVFNFQSTDGITVTYAPESGYEFYLWQSEKDGRSSVLIAETVDGTTVIRPEYGTTISPVFREPTLLPIFGVDDKYYYYWDDAMQVAKQSESQTAILYSAYDLPADKDTAGRYGAYAVADVNGNMTYTIPTGVTLSIRNRLTIPSGVALQAYGSGAWLTVNAKIQVSRT